MARKPYIFIGSSSEGLTFAEAIQANLQEVAECQVWHQDFFTLSDGILESLIRELPTFDFAILVLTGDDVTISRDVERTSPRDNIIFELGLFIGGLGKNRVYMAREQSADLKLPSDLAGIVSASFEKPDRATAQAALGPASVRIRREIAHHGLRPEVRVASVPENDLALVTNLIRSKGYTMMSFERIRKYYPKFDDAYCEKLIETYPNKIRKSMLEGTRPGIGLL